MAIITIAELPPPTRDEAMLLFREHFAGRYDVYPVRMRGRQFVVRKTDWSGVGVRVKPARNGGTTFVYTAMMPNLLLQGLFGGLISYLFLRAEWKALEREVASFLETAPRQRALRPAA